MQHEVANPISRSAQQADDVVLPREAVERRRVLNILAQRRHRRRKKERLAAADRILAGAGSPNTRPVEAAVNDSHPDYNHDRSTLLPSNYDFDFENLSWEPGTFTAAPIAALSDDPFTIHNVTDILQDEAIQTSTCPDDYNLSMPDLDLLRAALENGKRLNRADRLFSLTAESIFQSGDGLGWTFALPENLKPTPAQLSLPHHPIIDVLPWPQVRTKLIMLYSQPAEFWPRHPADGSALTVIRTVYDMEDGGVRVRGSEPWSENAWEIEQAFFETWWFALDRNVVRSTNLKRLVRGQPALCEPRVCGMEGT